MRVYLIVDILKRFSLIVPLYVLLKVISLTPSYRRVLGSNISIYIVVIILLDNIIINVSLIAIVFSLLH